MLKPNRKILRKEIKKDPLIETLEKIESRFEKNRKAFINFSFFFIALVIGGIIFMNNQKDTELESNSALSEALVAYSNLDYQNARFQFESISSSFEGTESEIFSKYYLGKIAYELGDYSEAKILLNDFLENTRKATFVSGAIKQLVDIHYRDNDISKIFDIIVKAKKYDLNNISKLELKLLEIGAFIEINDLESAKIELEGILGIKKLPLYITQKINEFEGVLQVL